MNQKNRNDEPVYTDEPLEMEITEDFLPSPEELRKAGIRIISSSETEDTGQNAYAGFPKLMRKKAPEEIGSRLEAEAVRA